MNPDHPAVEVQVHTVDGHVARFAQSDPAAIAVLLTHLHPHKIFGQPRLLVAGTRSLSVFPSASIARVDLVMDLIPDWPFHHGVSDSHEITPEEFRQRFQPAATAADPMPAAGAPVVVFAEMELANGEQFVVEVHTHVAARLPVEQSMFVQQLLTAPSLHARRRGGGVVIVNPVNIVRLTFYPGPVTAPANVVWADPLPG